MIWGHATHIDYENTGNNWDPPAPLEYTHYDSMNAAPSTLIVTIGCHSGYHSSHQSDVGHFGPYGAGLVKSALEKEVSYLAPTTYGLRTGNSAQLHELIFKGFFNNLFEANTPTIGEAIKKAIPRLLDKPPTGNDPNLRTRPMVRLIMDCRLGPCSTQPTSAMHPRLSTCQRRRKETMPKSSGPVCRLLLPRPCP